MASWKNRVQISLDELESLVGKSSLDLNEFFWISFYGSISSKQNNTSRSTSNEVVVAEEEEEENEESDLVKAFEVFDLNGDGFISCDELQKVLSRLGLWDENSGKDSRVMIHVYDTNLDGQLDFEEFKNMMFLTISWFTFIFVEFFYYGYSHFRVKKKANLIVMFNLEILLVQFDIFIFT